MDITTVAQVQIRFTISEGEHELTDAIYYPVDAVPPQEEIEAEQRRRFENFKAVVTAPPAPQVEPTPEDVQVQIDSLFAQKEQIEAQIATLTPVLEAKTMSMEQALADGTLVIKG